MEDVLHISGFYSPFVLRICNKKQNKKNYDNINDILVHGKTDNMEVFGKY